MHARTGSAVLVAAIALGACGVEMDAPLEEADDVSSEVTGAGGPVRGLDGKCLDVANGSTADGAKIQLWTCNGTAAQTWRYENETLIGAGNKCLDVTNGATTSGTRVQLYTCNGTAAQRWTRRGNTLVGGSGKCLDVMNNTSADGTPVAIWDCNGGANQSWTLPSSSTVDAGSPTTDAGNAGGVGFPAGDFTSPVTGHTYKKVLAEDFNTSTGSGSAFTSAYANSFCYGSESSQYSVNSLSASGGNMVVSLNGKGMQGVFAQGGCKTAWTGLTYGVYAIRFKAVKATGYGAAIMWWPSSNVWGEGEIDAPEGNFGGNLNVFQHGTKCTDCSANVYHVGSNLSFQDWNTVTVEWSPTGMVYYFNGKVAGSYAGSVPYNPHRFTIQMAGGGEAGQFLIDWVAEYTY